MLWEAEHRHPPPPARPPCPARRFSCMSTNPSSILRFLTRAGPISPGCLQPPGRCRVCLGKAGGNPYLQELGAGSSPGWLTGALCWSTGRLFSMSVPAHTRAGALSARGGQHGRGLSHTGEKWQFCSPLSSVEILKQAGRKQVNLSPLAWLCPWQPGSQAGSPEKDRPSECNHQSNSVPKWIAVPLPWGQVLEFPGLYSLACLLSTCFLSDLNGEGNGRSLQVLVWAWIMASAFLDLE